MIRNKVLFFETRTLVCISRNHEVNRCFKEPSRELDHASRNQGILFCFKESGNRFLYKKKPARWNLQAKKNKGTGPVPRSEGTSRPTIVTFR
jgi:hypothetical protein